MLLRNTNSDITCSHHHLTICAIIQIVTPKQGHAPQPQGETRPCHMSLPAVVPATMVAATGDCRLLTLDINLNRIPSRAMANRMRGRGNMQPKRLGRRGFMVKFVGDKTWGHLQDWERITRQSLISWMTIIRETCMEKKTNTKQFDLQSWAVFTLVVFWSSGQTCGSQPSGMLSIMLAPGPHG